MKKKWNYILVPLISLFILCNCGSSVTKTDDGIIIAINNKETDAAKKIKLQVITDDIIHVEAITNTDFTKKESLITSYK